MSEYLFHRPKSRRTLRFKLAAFAVVALLACAAFSVWVGARYLGLTGNGVVATAKLVTVGDSLGINSNVKYRGLRVGRVVSVSGSPDARGQYSAMVVIDTGYAGEIPADVTARVLPGTLFGAEYVDLEAPATATAMSTLRSGTTIAADTSAASVHVMDTFNALYRVMSQVDPSTVNLGISQLADALRGRGPQLRQDIKTVTSLIGAYSSVEPTFYDDLEYVSTNLTTLASVEPDLAATLRNALPLAQMITTKRSEIASVLPSASMLAGAVNTFLVDNAPMLQVFLANVAPTYRAFADGSGAFGAILGLAPAVLANGAADIVDHAITMSAKFAAKPIFPYTRSDCPRYGFIAGRNC